MLQIKNMKAEYLHWILICFTCFLTVPISLSYLLQIISELPTSDNWNFDLHWYRKIPGVIAASSFDGKIGIYNLEVMRAIIFHFGYMLNHYETVTQFSRPVSDLKNILHQTILLAVIGILKVGWHFSKVCLP